MPALILTNNENEIFIKKDNSIDKESNMIDSDEITTYDDLVLTFDSSVYLDSQDIDDFIENCQDIFDKYGLSFLSFNCNKNFLQLSFRIVSNRKLFAYRTSKKNILSFLINSMVENFDTV